MSVISDEPFLKPKEVVVSVCRAGYGFATIKIPSAISLRDAAIKADEQAGNIEFSENNADYSIDTITISEAT